MTPSLKDMGQISTSLTWQKNQRYSAAIRQISSDLHWHTWNQNVTWDPGPVPAYYGPKGTDPGSFMWGKLPLNVIMYGRWNQIKIFPFLLKWFQVGQKHTAPKQHLELICPVIVALPDGSPGNMHGKGRVTITMSGNTCIQSPWCGPRTSAPAVMEMQHFCRFRDFGTGYCFP